MKKTLLGIIIVSTIICLTQASCNIFEDLTKPSLKVVNKNNLPITRVAITSIDNVSLYTKYHFMDVNIPKGRSKIFFLGSFFDLESYSAPYNAEVTVYFGKNSFDMYSYKEYEFESVKTTTATLNVNGILE